MLSCYISVLFRPGQLPHYPARAIIRSDVFAPAPRAGATFRPTILPKAQPRPASASKRVIIPQAAFAGDGGLVLPAITESGAFIINHE
jgi:hypothetical protein